MIHQLAREYALLVYSCAGTAPPLHSGIQAFHSGTYAASATAISLTTQAKLAAAALC